MDIVDYGNYVDYGYFGPCGLWIQWIAGIMSTLDHVDYEYSGLWGLFRLRKQWIVEIKWIMGTLNHVDCMDYGDYVYIGLRGLCGLWVLQTLWIMDRVDYVYSGFLSDKVKSFHNDNVIWMSVLDIMWIHGGMAKLCIFLPFPCTTVAPQNALAFVPCLIYNYQNNNTLLISHFI